MIFTSHPISPAPNIMLDFLRERVGLTDSAINLGVRQSQVENTPLPIILWSFGLISINEYIELINWQASFNKKL